MLSAFSLDLLFVDIIGHAGCFILSYFVSMCICVSDLRVKDYT